MSTALFEDSLQRGHSLYAKGDFVAAEQAYAEAVAANPIADEGYRSLAFAQYSQAKYAESKANAAKAVAMDSAKAENHFAEGLALAALQELDAAVDSLEQALKLKPDHAHAKSTLANVLIVRAQSRFAKGDEPGGESDLTQAIRLDRKNPEPVRLLSKHFLDAGLKPRAVKLVEEAILANPTDPTIKSMALHLGVSVDSRNVSDAVKKQAVQQSQQKPCPACKAMVMEWTAVCPRCGSQISALPSQFAGRDTGPDRTWQEVVGKILAVLWFGYGAWQIYQGMMLRSSRFYFAGMEAIFVIMGSLYAGIGLGLFFEIEWLQFIAKIVCWLALLNASYTLLIGLGLGHVGQLLLGLLLAAVASLQLYVLKETADV